VSTGPGLGGRTRAGGSGRVGLLWGPLVSSRDGPPHECDSFALTTLMLLMPMPYRPTFLVLGALGLCLTGACKEDPPTPKLFDEEGVWSVINYAIDESGNTDINEDLRGDAFMLSFDSSERVVTSAACLENEGDTVVDSPCLTSPSTTYWDCRCFGYDFEREEMLWREFNAGDTPPVVKLSEAGDPPASGETGTSGDGGGGGDGDTLVRLSGMEGVASTYTFLPLPTDLFGSDGMSSRFVFRKRAALLFDRAFEDPDGRPGCTPCVP
jgi:hypothetical protein